MKLHKIPTIILFTLSFFISNKTFAGGNTPLSEATEAGIELKLKSTNGTNGSGVAWNPDKKLYYTIIAGNEEFPVETFNENGKFLYKSDIGADLRGLWYNTKSKTLEANGYNNYGLFRGNLTVDGYATGFKSVKKGTFQPADNSCGAYDAKKGVLYYLDGDKIQTYSAKSGGKGSSNTISGLGEDDDMDYMNTTSLIYTGKKGYEIGMLDYDGYKIILMNKKGEVTAHVDLPGDAMTNDMFRIAYANDILWLYDTDSRIWTGYNIFE